MKPALLAVASVLLAIAHRGEATEPAATSLAKPYYDCVKSAVVRYAHKSPGADDVIQAAVAVCQKDRNDLKAIVEASANNSEKEPRFKTIDEHVEGTLETLESTWRPDLIKAILDAR